MQRKECETLKGFTLVELIVVISILAILGTIGFISLQGYSSGARDSARVSDVANISKGLDLVLAKGGSLPQPSPNMITVFASGSVVGYQWYAGDSILSMAWMSAQTQDQKDKTYYTYLTNFAQNRYQILWFLENAGGAYVSLDLPINTAYAAAYDTRTPFSRGDSVGVLLGTVTGSTLNQPVQELYNAASFTGVDLVTSVGGAYKAYVSSTTVLSGTGPVLIPMLSNLDASMEIYPGCDTKDIKLPNGQIWAACNVGATQAYIRVNQPLTITDSTSGGGPTAAQKAYGEAYYQWWRNDDVTTWSTAAAAAAWTLANTVGHSNFIPGTLPAGYDWIITQDDNLWWWQSTGTGVGTFATQGSPAAMQWPCQVGYHVPTHLEWCNAVRSIDATITACTNSTYTGTDAAINILKLPLAGYRRYDTSVFQNQGAVGYYWASSVSTGRNVCSVTFSPTSGVRTGFCGSRASGYSVRCMKN